MFQLSCLGKPNSVLQYNDFIGVQYINVSEGIVGIKYNSSFVEILFNMFSQFRFSSQGVVSNIFGKGPNLYVDPTESASVQWAVANLTCQQAQQNTSTYACVSTNSSCTRVISTMQGYVGYRCTCLPGYDGNPYIPDGCKGNYLFDQLRIQPDGIHIYILYPIIVFWCGILSCTKMKSLILMFPIFLLNKHLLNSYLISYCYTLYIDMLRYGCRY